MLTRAQVAKRLGKSIATVRRLEGSRLHPRRDADGIHRFDATEVDRLASGLRSGRAPQERGDVDARDGARGRSTWLGISQRDVSEAGDLETVPNDAALSCEGWAVRVEHVSRLDKRVQALEEQSSRKVAQDSSNALAQAMHNAIALEVVELANSLSDRELRRLDPDTLSLIEALLS